jgi:8-oxo-dGTP diphosphatase
MKSENEQSILEIDVCAAVIRRGGRWLLAERKQGSDLENHWEFPGGKLHEGESQAACITREIREELGVGIFCLGKMAEIRHVAEERTVILHFLACQLEDGEPRGCEGQKVGWFSLEEMETLLLAPADLQFLSYLKPASRNN